MTSARTPAPDSFASLPLAAATLHNLHFMLKLMRTIRASLDDGTFPELKSRWLSRRDPGPASGA